MSCLRISLLSRFDAVPYVSSQVASHSDTLFALTSLCINLRLFKIHTKFEIARILDDFSRDNQ